MFIDLVSVTRLLKVAVPVSFALHIFEEFVFPGTFPEWYHRYRPHLKGEPLSYYYKANLIYFLMTATVAFGPMRTSGYMSQLFVSAILLSNLLFTHVRGAIATRSYSPGMVTGILLYVPITVTTFWYLTSHALLSLPLALLSLGLSPMLEVYFALKPAIGVQPTRGAANPGAATSATAPSNR
ncbi:MAG TPA: HXXEE domain-containing protein [Gemmatimonadaceae bacterium]|jgi:hypothetical protein